MLTVSSIPFIGYDRDTKAWVFQDRAYNCGRELETEFRGVLPGGHAGNQDVAGGA